MINRLLWVSCLSYVLTGFTLVIVGAVLPELLAYYSRSYSDGGNLIFVQFIGFLAGVLCMPMINRSLGRRKAVIIGLFMMSVELCIVFLPAWPFVVLLAGTAGFGAGIVESCIGTIVLMAVKERQAIAMSKLEVTFGIGALLMPFIASFLIAKGVWAFSFLILGVCSLLMVVWWTKLSFGDIDQLLARKDGGRNTEVSHSSFTGSRLPVVALFSAFFFFYGGSEISVVHFFPSIFMEKWGINSSYATLTVTVFWSAMVIGRSLFGFIAEKLTYYRYLQIVSTGGLLVLVTLAFCGNVLGGFALSFLLGLFMAGMFAVALIFANHSLPGMTERTTSIMLASTGLGGSLLPIIVGWCLDEFPVEASFWLFAAAMLIMLLLIITSGRWKERKKDQLEIGTSASL